MIIMITITTIIIMYFNAVLRTDSMFNIMGE